MIVVDTSVWIDYFRDLDTKQTRWLDRKLSNPEVGLTDLSLCEILQGEPDDRLFDQVRRALLEFAVHPTGGSELSVQSAQHYRLLRKQGITIRSTIDCLIATFCIRAGHFLLHNDRDFDVFERHLGLKVLHP